MRTALAVVTAVAVAVAALATMPHRASASSSPFDANEAMDLSRFVGPRALVFGDIDFTFDRRDADGAASATAPSRDADADDELLCALVSLDVSTTGERHEVRLCAPTPTTRGAKFTRDGIDVVDDRGVVDDGANATDGVVTTKHFSFGLERSPIGSECVVRVKADANAVVEPIGPGTSESESESESKSPSTLTLREFTTTRAMTSDGTYMRLPVVIKRRGRGRGRGGMSRELATTIACAFVLAAANVALGMWNRHRRRRQLAREDALAREDIDGNAPESPDASFEELVGRLNYERVMTILEDQEERRRIPVPTSDFLVYARAPALEYGTREKTGDLVHDFLTAYPQSIAPTYMNPNDSDSEDEYLREEFGRRGDVDIFGNKFIRGRTFDLKIYGHGRQAGKLLLSHVLSHDSFCDAKLKNYTDERNEE